VNDGFIPEFELKLSGGGISNSGHTTRSEYERTIPIPNNVTSYSVLPICVHLKAEDSHVIPLPTLTRISSTRARYFPEYARS